VVGVEIGTDKDDMCAGCRGYIAIERELLGMKKDVEFLNRGGELVIPADEWPERLADFDDAGVKGLWTRHSDNCGLKHERGWCTCDYVTLTRRLSFQVIGGGKTSTHSTVPIFKQPRRDAND